MGAAGDDLMKKFGHDVVVPELSYVLLRKGHPIRHKAHDAKERTLGIVPTLGRFGKYALHARYDDGVDRLVHLLDGKSTLGRVNYTHPALANSRSPRVHR